MRICNRVTPWTVNYSPIVTLAPAERRGIGCPPEPYFTPTLPVAGPTCDPAEIQQNCPQVL